MYIDLNEVQLPIKCIASWQYIDFSYNLFNILKTLKAQSITISIYEKLHLPLQLDQIWVSIPIEDKGLKVEGSSLAVTHRRRSPVCQTRMKPAWVWQRSCKNGVSQAWWFLVAEPNLNQCLAGTGGWEHNQPNQANKPIPPPWEGMPHTRPVCSKPHPTWPGTRNLPGIGHPQLLWMTCANASHFKVLFIQREEWHSEIGITSQISLWLKQQNILLAASQLFSFLIWMQEYLTLHTYLRN